MSASKVSVSLHQFKYDDFTERKKLGGGEFGRVYEVKHHQFPKLAVREISRRYHARAEERDALRKEAEKLLQIFSQHVIRFFGVVMEPEHLCLVFEFAEYGSLDKVLVRHKVPAPLKIRIAYEIALGMCFLHDKNVLHLRLKCHNILIAGNIQAKISDVCFTRNREMNTWTRFADVYSRSVGYAPSQASGSSIANVPPELIRSVNATPDKTTDVYAYSIILWQILTTKTPYEGETADNVCNRIVGGRRPMESLIPEDKPEVLNSVMLKCWKDAKGERPSFRQICSEIKPKFEEVESSARDCALKCQKDLEDFCFKQANKHRAPEGDIPSYDRSGKPYGTDGFAVPMSGGDERVGSTSRTVPDVKGVGMPHTNEGYVERRVSQDNKCDNADETLPAETSIRVVTHEDLYQVAEDLGNRWREFGRFLEFTDGQLDNIAMNFQREGFPETPYQMLRQWKNHAGPITVGYLATLLKSNGKLYIAQKLNP